MSEAYGPVCLKTTPEISAKFDEDMEQIQPELLTEIYELAGVDIKKCNPYSDNIPELWQEGISKNGDWVTITIFGEEWMGVIKPLVEEGNNIEIYGRISHEYGFTEYYALTADGTRFCEAFDQESSENEGEEEVIRKNWKKLRPDSLKD